MCSAKSGSGGGVYLAANGATLSNISDSEFTSNSAGEDGGGLNVTGGATVLTGNTFVGNHAGRQGGAVAYDKQCFTAGTVGALVLFHRNASVSAMPCSKTLHHSGSASACKAHHAKPHWLHSS